MTEDTGQKLGIDWLKTIAGALAAVSSAVLLSTLGAAGTIIGAALGSVVVTVGGALYGQGLARSRARLAQVPIAPRRASRHHATSRDRPGRRPTRAPARRERFRALPWKRISLGAAGLFAAAILAITAFEVVAGEKPSRRSPAAPTEAAAPRSPASAAAPTAARRRTTPGPVRRHDVAVERALGPGVTHGPASPTAEPTDEATESPSGSTSPTPAPATPTTPGPRCPQSPPTTP